MPFQPTVSKHCRQIGILTWNGETDDWQGEPSGQAPSTARHDRRATPVWPPEWWRPSTYSHFLNWRSAIVVLYSEFRVQLGAWWEAYMSIHAIVQDTVGTSYSIDLCLRDLITKSWRQRSFVATRKQYSFESVTELLQCQWTSHLKRGTVYPSN